MLKLERGFYGKIKQYFIQKVIEVICCFTKCLKFVTTKIYVPNKNIWNTFKVLQP